jgi:hypothetical protein
MITINGFEVPLAAVAGFTSALIAGIAAVLVWLQWRERRMRQDDVLKWALEVIRVQQTLYVTLYLGDAAFDAEATRSMLAEMAVDSSVLVEQGRLFFKNAPHATHGSDRHEAYRGHRSMLLDPIVVSHQIACQWEGATAEDRERMLIVAGDSVRAFVSMAQREVGRRLTPHDINQTKGEGEKLESLLAKVKPERLAALKANARLSL